LGNETCVTANAKGHERAHATETARRAGAEDSTIASYQKFNAFVEHEAEKVHKLDTDALKIMLVNSPAPVATNTVKADLTEIGTGNGYSAGGGAVTVTTSSQSSGTYTLAANQVVFTASGGSIGPFRYAVLYNDTPTSPADPLIAWWDYGSGITLNDGETFTVKFSSTDPGNIFTKA